MNTAWRVWDGENMHYWNDEGLSLEIKMGEWILWREEGRGCRVSIAESGDGESVLMWHIGLLDKNNKAIYQNDFFEFANGVKGVVEWIEEEAIFNVRNYYDSYSDCPSPAFSGYAHRLDEVGVIGDAFQNPELLEVLE